MTYSKYDGPVKPGDIVEAVARQLDNMQSPDPDPPKGGFTYAQAFAHGEQVWPALIVSEPAQVVGWWCQVLIADRTVAASLSSATRSARKGDRVGVMHSGGTWTVAEIYTEHAPPTVPAPPTGTIPSVSGSTTVPSTSITSYTRRDIDVPTRTLRQPDGYPSTYQSSWALSVNQAIADLRSSMYDVYDSLRAVQNYNLDRIEDATSSLRSAVLDLRDAASSINGRVSNTQQAVNTAGSIVNGTRVSLSSLQSALGPDGERIVK